MALWSHVKGVYGWSSASVTTTVNSTPFALSFYERVGFAQQRRLVELIEGQLGSDLSLTRLAEEIGLSTFHFARAFKATFGVTPHLYVQGRRLDAAARALRSEHGRPIADIALACGFSSQSHMTELMRRKMGTTPRGMRQWNSSKQER